jgi:hypothetical protein
MEYGRGALESDGLREGVVHGEAFGSGNRSGGIAKKTPTIRHVKRCSRK